MNDDSARYRKSNYENYWSCTDVSIVYVGSHSDFRNDNTLVQYNLIRYEIPFGS